jgi:hypothetical protein
MNFKNLSEHQLINFARDKGLHDKELNDEWYKRYGMNFPYKLDIRNRIYNVLMDRTMNDEEVDKMILGQANRLREERNYESF